MKHQIGSTIYESEVALFEALRQTYSEDTRDSIVSDGLCWASISTNMPDKSNHNWPECLWTESKRRVLFFLKEPNKNEGEDYKDWDWAEDTQMFGNVLAYWLEGLMTTRKNYCPNFSEISSRKDIFKKYPLAIVNAKKIAGGSKADWNVIWEYAKRDKSFLYRQIRDILKPNIIVCCGSNDKENNLEKVFGIALDCIFQDIKNGFRKINNWCYYNSEEEILLIDSYHPSELYKTVQKKYEELINNFHDFILKTDYRF